MSGFFDASQSGIGRGCRPPEALRVFGSVERAARLDVFGRCFCSARNTGALKSLLRRFFAAGMLVYTKAQKRAKNGHKTRIKAYRKTRVYFARVKLHKKIPGKNPRYNCFVYKSYSEYL
jgi:hypothetical protein